jgi:hypothetical protein
MNKTLFRVRLTVLGAMLAGAVSFAASSAFAQVVELRPNLTPLPASNLSLNTASGTSTLRFSTTSWNNGAGPLQLEAGPVDTGSGKQQVNQRIFSSDGSSAAYFAGWVEWHAAHNHFHFNDYALYTLQPVNAPGGSERTGSKTTFCVMDTTKINTGLPGAPGSAVYSTCGNQIQGMSVGWGDTYGYNLAGQELDFTNNADGVYRLKIEIDPKTLIRESNDNDNVSCVLLNIIKPSSVTVLDNSGSCTTTATTVTSIDPNSVRMGFGNWVTIIGSGFTQGMSVSFEGGSGPRPAVNAVNWRSDTEVQAYVTVPVKKQLGRDPVWDVRVGSGGVLPNAFTVTR